MLRSAFHGVSHQYGDLRITGTKIGGGVDVSRGTRNKVADDALDYFLRRMVKYDDLIFSVWPYEAVIHSKQAQITI